MLNGLLSIVLLTWNNSGPRNASVVSTVHLSKLAFPRLCSGRSLVGKKEGMYLSNFMKYCLLNYLLGISKCFHGINKASEKSCTKGACLICVSLSISQMQLNTEQLFSKTIYQHPLKNLLVLGRKFRVPQLWLLVYRAASTM